MIKYEILQVDTIRIVCQTVRRITNEILGVKGLNDQSLSIIWGGGDHGKIDCYLTANEEGGNYKNITEP